MRTNKGVSAITRNSSYAGRVLVTLSFGVAIYKIINAKNKVKETEKQAVTLSSAYLGSDIGGGIGALFGPFDIVTVPLGIFVGGLLGGMFGNKIAAA